MKKEPGTTNKRIGSKVDLFYSLMKRFEENTEKWKGQRPPINVTRERVRMWFRIRDLKRLFRNYKRDI